MTWLTSVLMGALVAGSSSAALAVTTSDFNGTWRPAKSIERLTSDDGQAPPLLPAARALMAQHLEDRAAGKLDFDGTATCKAPGVPRIMLMGGAFQLLQDQQHVFMLHHWNRELRIIDLNIPHSAQNIYAPTYFGFSVGTIAGRTLTIDTTGYNDTTLLDDAGLPHSEVLHTIEHYTLSDKGDKLLGKITIEDPKTFSKAWSFSVNFVRAPDDAALGEDICVERQHLLNRKAKNPS